MAQTQAEKFFYKHAGYPVSPGESKEAARRRAARLLARAEEEAERRGWTYEWSHEDDPDVSWMDEEQLADYRSGQIEMLEVLLRDENGKVLQALGGIAVRRGDRTQGRLTEAELAAEALTRALSNPFTRFPNLT